MNKPNLHNRKGTALIEFTMAIPLLASVIGFTFFFGYAMMNQQHVKIADRYSAWRNVYGGASSGGTINNLLFGDKAGQINLTTGVGPDDVLQQYVSQVNSDSAAAGVLARACVIDSWPRGSGTHIGATFPSDVGLYNRFKGAIEHSHIRDGVEWRRGQAASETEIVNEFLVDFDRTLSNVNQPGGALANTFRRLYNTSW